ncbi:hypothetical protein LDO26_17945 [Luteimonas sp. BDR2-5]|uniref:hypothetical protein n=1 Tax=Proluteimonas luteida TaxID=2878685 RepID=UPI001E4F7DCC|nr:hypothetical protein [Luteimonas sp. BDR2-5]MCD9030074.1 hypothetical protein [Luteimonas sp. BDR2-5]
MLLMAMGLAPAAAEESDARLRYACDPGMDAPRLELMAGDTGGAPVVLGDGVEWIDVAPLQRFDDRTDPRSGQRLRAGSETLTRRCGAYTVEIRAGFYNPDPQGEMGGAPAYPIVGISEAGRGHIGTFAMGVCGASNPRYSYLVQCPSDWATRVLVVGAPAVRGTMLELRRAHDDIRLLAPLPPGASP